MSKHGIFVREEATALSVPITGSSSVQVVIGTAPVNMAEDISAAVNIPVLANSAEEAMKALGYCKDFANYTLCQSMYATANIYLVSPVVYINVLNPTKHKKAMEKQTVSVSSLQATVKVFGVLASGISVKSGEVELTSGEDYTTEFDSDGYLTINLVKTGKGATATELTVDGTVIDPTLVTKDDIIGAVDTATGKETGMQLIRQVYPKLGVVPGLLLAPGWSQIPEIGIALMAKAAVINGVFQAMALLDLDTTKAKKYTDCKTVKEESGYTSTYCYPLWPMFKVGEMIFAASAIVGALVEYIDAANDDVPSNSPSNKVLGMTGTCLADGTEVVVDQDQASTVNTYGVTTAINMDGWRLWGNYTGAYPGSTDAKDIWFPVRRMFNWQGNNFIRSYISKVDDPMNHVLVENIVDSENIRCNAYAPDKWAGARIEYLSADNPTTDILAGKMTFRQHIAPYTPAQEIDNVLDYDTALLTSALTGGNS